FSVGSFSCRWATEMKANCRNFAGRRKEFGQSIECIVTSIAAEFKIYDAKTRDAFLRDALAILDTVGVSGSSPLVPTRLVASFFNNLAVSSSSGFLSA